MGWNENYRCLFKQQEVTTKRADLVGEIDLFSSSDIENATLIIQDKNSLIQYGKISSRLSKGTNKIKVPLQLITQSYGGVMDLESHFYMILK